MPSDGPAIAHIGDATSPADRLRIRWGQTLAELMERQYGDRAIKPFRRDLNTVAVQMGFSPVTRQAIDQWLSGRTAPRPQYQAAIARVFRMPAHLIFSVEEVA